MKYFKVIGLAFFLCTMSVFSQESTIKHTIVKGETISSIAQKYNVSIESIYKLNPKAKKTLQLNQVLQIPNSEPKKANNVGTDNSEKITEISYQVLPKETLYGITKKYKTTTELLYKANPQLESEGLKVGQTIVIPTTLTKKEIAGLTNSKCQEEVVTDVVVSPLTHEVKPKESLYVIAKMYGVTLKELQNANPSIGKKGLSIGQSIVIPANGKLPENTAVAEQKKTEVKEEPRSENKNNTSVVTENAAQIKETQEQAQSNTSEVIHEVLTKETKYGIAKKYGITVAELEKQNPAIKAKLLVGSKLTIQVSGDKIEKGKGSEVVEAATETQGEKQQEPVKETTAATDNSASGDLIEKLIQFASENLGVRYRSGGTTSAGFDCSGLMYNTFGAFDIKLPRSSIEQSAVGEKVNDVDAQKGDLIFFKTNGRRQINHVGMVIEVTADEIKFIHSSTHSGVIVSSTKEPYYQRNFAQVNRVIK